MRVDVLGCSGGIGGRLRTTSFLIDADLLIDAGTGVADLSLSELASIDHIFVTHSHLDHIAAIPLLVDTVGAARKKPVTIHATEATIRTLREHIFNWKIWPDFTQILTSQDAYLRFEAVRIGDPVTIEGRTITAVSANHVVPTVGYLLDSGLASLIFSSDTTTNDEFWNTVNATENLLYLIIETAFANRDRQIALASKHLCPSLLSQELAKLRRPVEIYITHMKPGEEKIIMAEIADCVQGLAPKMLRQRQIFEF